MRTDPTAVSFGSTAYDPVRNQVVEFGGENSSGAATAATSVWTPKTQTWVPLSPATSPPARFGAGMAWDPTLNEIVLFGGRDAGSTMFGDMWAWTGTTWSQITPTGSVPSARYGEAFAWDPSRSALVLFGGQSSSTTYFNDTWAFSGAWSTVQANGASGAPTKRSLPAMVYSTSTSQMVLFGGASSGGSLSDTWVLGSSSWTQQSPTTSPGPRYGASAAFDPGLGSTGGLVVYGGFNQNSGTLADDTWAWNGTTWLQALSIATPGARYGAAIAATTAGQVLLFGGTTTSLTPSAQTWLYDTNVPVLALSFTDGNGNAASSFTTGDPVTVNVSAQNVGGTTLPATNVTSTLTDQFLAAGSLLTWAGATLGPCDSSATVCGAILGLSATISKITLSPGTLVTGSYVGTLVGSLVGCAILSIPATASNAFGSAAVASAPLTACAGGLGVENWWTYHSTSLGDGATAMVNVANGNLVVKQSDSTPITAHGQLGFELSRAYNSQDNVLTPTALGVGWQFDVGRTGPSGVGGYELGSLLVPTLEAPAQPLALTYVDGDGTRQVFSLHAISVTVGALSLPISINDIANSAGSALFKLLDPATLPFTLSSTVSGLTYNTLCLDATYTGPPGLDEYLFRYVGVASSTCAGNTTKPSAVTVGWSIVRPDRVRYDFDPRGQLLDAVDGAGSKMAYHFDVEDRLSEVHSTACTYDTTIKTNPVTGPACPHYSLSYTDVTKNGRDLSRIDVTDPAGRLTTYLVTHGFEPVLQEVWEPDNPFSLAAVATPSWSYTYSTATTPCPGSATGTVTVGDMCSVTNPDGETTAFAYQPSPVGPDRIMTIKDRRATTTGGTNTGAETLFSYNTGGAYVTADTAAPATLGSATPPTGCINNSACERTRYAGVDTAGRVGEIDDGNAADLYLHQQGFFWDGDAIPSCEQPGNVVDNNLCESITRAVPSSTPLTPSSVGTSTVNGVTVADQAVKYLYGDMGQLLRKTELVDPSAGWTEANSRITTYGSHEQYFENDGTVKSYDDTVEGSGQVTSTAPQDASAYANAVNTDNPIEYYRFRETSGTTLQNSAPGGGHTGLYNGDVSNLTDNGRIDRAVHELGGTWMAGLQNGTGLITGAGANSSFSVESWVKTTNTGVDYQTMIGLSTNAYLAVGRYTGGVPGVYITSDAAGGHAIGVVGTEPIADGQWHQLDVTYDGTVGNASGVAIYVDGQPISTTVTADSLNGPFADATSGLIIGDSTTATGVDQNSMIDELSLYQGVLTPTKIQQHYAAGTGNTRLDAGTLYAIADQTEMLTPRGNAAAAASHWGDYLTRYRRDIPSASTPPSSYPRPNQTAANSVCGSAQGGNTGLLCETDRPASAGVPVGDCASPLTGLPDTPPTSSGYAHACSSSTYDSHGQKITQTSPDAHANSAPDHTSYTYYSDTGSCSADRNDCDLSGTVSIGGMLKSITDPIKTTDNPNGHFLALAYDRAGNVARTWSRNATQTLASPDQAWTTPGTPPAPGYAEVDHANPVTSLLLSLTSADAEVIGSNGTVSGSGSNGSGELGNGATTATSTPVPVPGLAHVVEIAQTSNSTCHRTLARTSTGALYQWGNGATAPTLITGLPATIALAAGGCHLLALDRNGDLWAWGSNASGQLGDGTTTDRVAPVKVLSGVATVAAGNADSLAVKTDGTIWAWGDNGQGQLGDGTTTARHTPTQSTGLSRMRAVAAGYDTSYALRADGTVWAWGNNASGALGTGSAANQTSTAQQLGGIGQNATVAQPVRQVVGTYHGAAALMADGTVQAWGDNSAGQLGGATGAVSSSVPLLVPGVTQRTALAGTDRAYLSADGTGKITIWGLASQGQIGDGTTPSGAVTPQPTGYDASPFSAPWRYVEGTRDPVGNFSLTTADPQGRVLINRPARGTATLTSAFDTTMSYDQDGDLVSTLAPMERNGAKASTATYDPFGNATVKIDPRGNATVSTYDSVNRTITVQTTRSIPANSAGSGCDTTAPSGGPWPAQQVGHAICQTSATYDGNDQTITTTDANSQTTTTTYDGVGEKIRQDAPRYDGTYTTLTTQWIYDADGNVTDVCPPRQFDSAHEQDTTSTCTSSGAYSTHSTYDNAGLADTSYHYRVTGPTSATKETSSSSYDADGNPINVTDADGHITTTTYDLLDRKISQAVPRSTGISLTTRWEYDPSGNVTAVIAPGPGAVSAGTGEDGILTIDGTTAANSTDHVAHGQVNPYPIPDGAQYTSVTLQSGGWVTSADAHGLVFFATGTITICSTCGITEAGKGYTGGAGASTAQHSGFNAANPVNVNNGNGGLGGGAAGLLATAAGGGGGGHASAGTAGSKGNGSATPGAGGAASGQSDLSDVGSNYLLGGGGGGGGGGTSLSSTKAGNGGNGGGFVHITANNLILNGTIDASGGAGAAAGNYSGGGGGGAGGAIWLDAGSLTPTDPSAKLNVAGGTGGTSGSNATGGAGSAGYTRINIAGHAFPLADDVTAYSYDLDNRVIDTVNGAQTTDATSTADVGKPDSAGLTNQRTRTAYDADGNVVLTMPPQSFSTSGPITTPSLNSAVRTDYDLDGHQTTTYRPRYDAVTTDVPSGGDGGTSTDQQTAQCPTGSSTPDAAPGYGPYPPSVGVCLARGTYDPDGNLARQYLPTSTGSDNRYLDYSYTDDNQTLTVTGPNPAGSGRITQHTYLYDGDGRVISDTDANGNQTVTAYTADGLTVEVDGQAYTVNGTTITHKTINTYDAAGNQATSKAPNAQSPTAGLTASDYTTTTTWTSDGLQAATQRPGLGHADFETTSYTYDPVGNPIQVKSPSANAGDANNLSGLKTINTFTDDNLFASTSVPIDTTHYRTTIYAYTPSGQKASTAIGRCDSGTVTDCTPANAAWHLGGVTRYTYAPDGLNIDQIGRNPSNGQPGTRTITTSYDQAGRPTSVTDTSAGSASLTVNATYYLDGMLRTAADGTNTNTYAYDASGNPTVRTDHTASGGVTNGATKITSYAYSDAALPTQMSSDVTSTTSAWSYDQGGRTIGRLDKSGSSTVRALSIGYNPDDTIASYGITGQPGNVATDTYQYDDNGNITRQAVTGAQSFTSVYGYNPADNLLTFDQSNGGSTSTHINYSFDHDANRLTSATTVGNPVSTTTWTYRADDSINTSQIGGGGALQYQYSPAGELTDDGCLAYSYDEFQRTAQVGPDSSPGTSCPANASTTKYTYDGLDRQREIDVTGTHTTSTVNVYDGLTSTLVGQTGAVTGGYTSPAPTVLYQLDADGSRAALAQTQGTNTTKTLLDDDGHGNITSLLNTSGTGYACSVNYDPYGTPLLGASPPANGNGICAGGTDAASTGNAIWYQSQARSAATGTYQLGTRTYAPQLGAFTTPDSYRVSSPAADLSVGTDPLTRNNYAYVNGNPVNYSDPSGHCPKDKCGGGEPVGGAPGRVTSVDPRQPTYTQYYKPFTVFSEACFRRGGMLAVGIANCQPIAWPMQPNDYDPLFDLPPHCDYSSGEPYVECFHYTEGSDEHCARSFSCTFWSQLGVASMFVTLPVPGADEIDAGAVAVDVSEEDSAIAALRARGPRSIRDKGALGEWLAVRQAKLDGEEVVGRQIYFRTKSGVTIADVVTRLPNGQLKIREAKFGAATLRSNQVNNFRDLMSTGGQAFGKRATAAGIAGDQGPIIVQVDWYT